MIAEAAEAGIVRLGCCGSHEADWDTVLDLAERHEEVYPSFGLHPWYVADKSRGWLRKLRGILLETPAGVGEIGLDHALENRNDADQEEVFLAQLQLASELGRPVSIHCRRAWERMIELLSSNPPLPDRFMIHSYSGGTGPIADLARLGAWFSFSGTITRSGNKKGREALKAVPAERLLIETDAPDLNPIIEGKIAEGSNLPVYLTHVLSTVAELRGLALDEAATLTWDNANHFFGLTQE